MCKDASMPLLFHSCVFLTKADGHSSTVELEDCVLENMGGHATSLYVWISVWSLISELEVVGALSC
jgi:hypothetical protein